MWKIKYLTIFIYLSKQIALYQNIVLLTLKKKKFSTSHVILNKKACTQKKAVAESEKRHDISIAEETSIFVSALLLILCHSLVIRIFFQCCYWEVTNKASPVFHLTSSYLNFFGNLPYMAVQVSQTHGCGAEEQRFAKWTPVLH